MLVGVPEQQVLESSFSLQHADRKVSRHTAGRRTRRRGRPWDELPGRGQLATQLLPATCSHCKTGFSLLQQVHLSLKSREVVAPLLTRQHADIALLEIGKARLGIRQALFQVGDLAAEKLLGFVGARTISAQGAFHEVVQQRPDDVETRVPIRMLVDDRIHRIS